MEITTIGVSGPQNTGIGQTAGQLAGVASAAPTAESAQAHPSPNSSGQAPNQALSILRQEIRLLLSTQLRIHFAAPPPAYRDNAGDVAPEDVAAETLGAAKQLARRSPLHASTSLIDLRSRIKLAAESVRVTVRDHDHDDMDDALGRVSDGLDKLDKDAARNVEWSATVLSAETRLKQRSTIRIRTQEGDIVRLDLRHVEKMSANDVSMTDGDSMFASTSIEMSSRTRMVLRVNGDLNEAELAAIQNVFAQAEAIADEFFNGDLAAAFEMAAGMDFDAEQLARVNLRFREKFVSNVSFAAIGAVTPQPVSPAIPEIPTLDDPVVVRPPMTPAPPTPVMPADPIAPPDRKEPLDTARPVGPEPDVFEDSALDNFFGLLSNFLRATSEGFEMESGSFRYYHSQSFKLEILRAVLQVSAPEESDDAANVAAALIDNVAATASED